MFFSTHRTNEQQPLLQDSPLQRHTMSPTLSATTTDSTLEPADSAPAESGYGNQALGVLFSSIVIDSIPSESLKESLCNPIGSGPLFSHDIISVILSYVLQNSINTVSVLVVGRLGPDELSTAAFSLMLAMVLGAIDTAALLLWTSRAAYH